MNNCDKFLKAIIYLALAIFIGGSIARLSIAFDLFIPGLLEIKPWYGEEIRLHSAWLFTSSGLYSGIGYILFLLASIVYLPRAIKDFKIKGYLLYCYIIGIAFAPVELYKIFCDIKLAFAFFDHSIKYGFIDSQIRDYFFNRFSGVFGAMSYLSIFAYANIALFLGWKPLTKKVEQVNQETQNIEQ